jgi:Ran GTPase-activating protein (RanGAP) involved in mRNA processing and transport
MIDLNVNQIGDKGTAALAEALKVNTLLTQLALRNNNIGVDGASALADALKVNTSATKIWLNDNAIGAEGAAALFDALKVNTSLTTIWLNGNQVDETMCDKIDALAARNERFRRVLLFDARQMLLSRLRGSGDECGVVWLFFYR